MKRIALLTIAAGLLWTPLAAMATPIDPAPMMNVKDLKELPGTPVPITPPRAPKPCAPILKGELKELPGTPMPLVAPRLAEPRK